MQALTSSPWFFFSASLVAAIAIDRFPGEPPNRLHPVAWMGALIRIATPARRLSPALDVVLGTILALALPLILALLTHKLLLALSPVPAIAWLVHLFLLKTMFSLDGLRRAGARMQAALGVDLDSARRALSWLCSRDPAALQRPQLVAATIESIAENASDSVIAPWTYYALFGLPGAVFYRTVNTMDAMIGYRGRFEYFGKAAARLDDALNYIPARLSAGLLLLAAGLGQGRVRGGLGGLLRDRRQTQSPNAGWPMATMAGLLDVTLEKPDHYRLGNGPAPEDPALIDEAFAHVRLASLLYAGLLIACLGAVHVTRQ